MTTAVAKPVVNVGVPDEQFRGDLIPKLRLVFGQVRECFGEAAKLLAPLAKRQLRLVKKEFRLVVSADQIHRLWLLGRGQMPAYLALAPKSIPGTTWETLSDETKEDLSDPSFVVEVQSRYDGPKMRTAKSLSPFEWSVVIDPGKGVIRTVEEQKKSFFLASARVPAKGTFKRYEFADVVPLKDQDGRPIPGKVVLRGHAGADREDVGEIVAGIEQLKRIFARM